MKVHFRLAGNDQPLLLVPTFVNGKGPYAFVLDTGAVQTLISLELAQDLGIEGQAVTGKQVIGASGRMYTLMSLVESLAVGSTALEHLPVMITDVDALSELIGTRIEGYLGYDYLKHFSVTIDFEQETVDLTQRDVEQVHHERNAAGEIPFKLARGANPLILLPTVVNREGPYEFALDTATSTTTISPELARHAGIKVLKTVEVMAGGGKAQGSIGEIDSLTVGTATISHLRVMVADFLQKLGQVAGTKLDGILGYNYLRTFIVTIDYPTGILRLDNPE